MAQRYWVSNGGNFDDSAHWSSVSGGGGGAGVPGQTDDAIFDQNSFTLTGQTVTIRSGHTNQCKNIDLSLVTKAPTITQQANATIDIYGNFTVNASPTFTAPTSAFYQFKGTGISNIYSIASLSQLQFIPFTGATLNLQSDITLGAINGNLGGAYTFNMNSFHLRISAFLVGRITFNGGSGILEIIDNAAFSIQLTIGNTAVPVTWNGGTGLIKFNATLATFNLSSSLPQSSLTLYDLEMAAGTNTINIVSKTLIVHDYTIDAGVVVKMNVQAPAIFEITGNFSANAGTIKSTVNGTKWNLKADNPTATQFVTVQDANVTGSIPLLDYGGINNGNNTGWSFPGAPDFDTLSPDLTSQDTCIDLTGTIPDASSLTEVGIVYSNTNNTPTIFDLTHVFQLNSGTFSTNFCALSPGTFYTFGIYIKTNAGLILYFDYRSIQFNANINKKRYYYKIYGSDLKYITTWSTDVISDPNFRMVLNGGAGELQVLLGRPYNSFGEGQDITLNNRVELWVSDRDNTNGTKIYTGFISQYSPVIDGQDEHLAVTVLGYSTRFATHALKDSTTGITTLTYSGVDPSAVMRDIIDKYHEDGGGDVFYTPSSIIDTGASAIYTYQNNTIQDAITKVIELTPENWFWYIDSNGIVFLQPANIAHPVHKLTIGKDLFHLESIKRLENLTNTLTIIGGGSPPLYNRYTRPASIALYGTWEKRLYDGRVTDDQTADLIAKHQLDLFDNPETRTILYVFDSNGENGNMGANIEAFFPGDSIQVVNLVDGPILIIQSIMYYPDHIEIEASTRLPETAKDLQNITDQLAVSTQTTLPVQPQDRVV